MSLFVKVSYSGGCSGSDVSLFPSLTAFRAVLSCYVAVGFVHHMHRKLELFVWLMDVIFPRRSEPSML
jgi:hypothetical protein